MAPMFYLQGRRPSYKRNDLKAKRLQAAQRRPIFYHANMDSRLRGNDGLEPQCDDLAFRLAFGLLGTATSKTKLLRDYRLFLLLFQ